MAWVAAHEISKGDAIKLGRAFETVTQILWNHEKQELHIFTESHRSREQQYTLKPWQQIWRENISSV